MSINRVIITGNLTRDPELNRSAAGMAILKMGVAVNDRRKNSTTGEWEDSVNFVDVTMFGTRAESVSRFLSKGKQVGIEGKLRWHQWESAAGEKRSKLEVIADDIELFGGPRDGGGGGARSEAPAYADAPADNVPPGEDIPF
jgi:single-strand DNA-binding protein